LKSDLAAIRVEVKTKAFGLFDFLSRASETLDEEPSSKFQVIWWTWRTVAHSGLEGWSRKVWRRSKVRRSLMATGDLPISSSEIIRQGYLGKRSGSNLKSRFTPISPSFNLRWFLLTPSSLSYHNSDKEVRTRYYLCLNIWDSNFDYKEHYLISMSLRRSRYSIKSRMFLNLQV